MENLRSIGYEASLRATAGQPMVVGHHPGPGSGAGPRVLYYGHYDVQPVEPLELWLSPPFEPTMVTTERGPRLVARGAVDDKGQVSTWLEALRAWHDVQGAPPVPVSVFLEGEEESGSPSLVPFLEANRDELRADICVVSDTGMWDIDTPAITTMLRGLIYVELTLSGPSRDLHSGMYGGAVPNPLNLLTRVLGQLHDAEGRVQIPGFYDDVRELEETRQWAELPFDEADFLAGAGLRTPFGEAGRSTLERIWSRPTCDLNGIWGGYTGPGSKTVIPAQASAKLSCRLVPEQDPARILESLRGFLDAPHARRMPLADRPPRALAGDPAAGRFALSAGGQARARGGLRAAAADGRHGRLDPGGRGDQAAVGHGFAAGRLRPQGRPGAFAQREVRAALLRGRHADPRPAARGAGAAGLRGGQRRSGDLDAADDDQRLRAWVACAAVGHAVATDTDPAVPTDVNRPAFGKPCSEGSRARSLPSWDSVVEPRSGSGSTPVGIAVTSTR